MGTSIDQHSKGSISASIRVIRGQNSAPQHEIHISPDRLLLRPAYGGQGARDRSPYIFRSLLPEYPFHGSATVGEDVAQLASHPEHMH